MIVKVIIAVSLFFILFGLAYWSGVIGVIGELADGVNTNFVARLPLPIVGIISIIGVGLVWGIISPWINK